jgi:hypothetical protein
MDTENPYLPVQAPRTKRSNSDRPFYIYATAVVLLLWAGIYMYLQSQFSVNTDSQNVYFSAPVGYANRIYFVNVPTLIALIALSLVFVNTVLWATLKLRRRKQYE